MEKKLTQNKVFRTIRNWLILAAALTAAWVLCSSLSTVGTSDTFVPMIFILAVLIVSLTTDGYFYGIVTSLASVIGVNYAFTFPYMKLNFSIYGYPVTFVTMLAVRLLYQRLRPVRASRKSSGTRLRRRSCAPTCCARYHTICGHR